ncbi:MAG: methyltransferase domain-containing protein, partial [Pseudomonadota bacterium]
MSIHHAPRVERVHATDISARMIDIAREKADAAGIDNIEFEVADID